VRFKELKSKQCEVADLNDGENSNPGSGFYPQEHDAANYMALFGPSKFQCLTDKNDVQMHGDFDSWEAANLMVAFEKCHPAKNSRGCKSTSEIDSWLEGRYLAILTNQSKFVENKFDNGKIESYSHIFWYTLSPNHRTEYVNTVHRSTMELNDSIFDIGGVAQEVHHGFTEEKSYARELSYRNLIHNAVTFEMSMNLSHYYRQVYSFLDFFSEVGGLLGALRPIFLSILTAFHFHGGYQFLTAHLFRNGSQSNRRSNTETSTGYRDV